MCMTVCLYIYGFLSPWSELLDRRVVANLSTVQSYSTSLICGTEKED